MLFDKELLKKVLALQSESRKETEVSEYVLDFARKLKKQGTDILIEEDTIGNLYMTKGKADYFPCVVSHMDTVHDIEDNKTITEVDGVLYAYTVDHKLGLAQIGTGGDDLVGVFLCLTMLKHIKNIKVCFFVQEEIGCIGSGEADEAFFEDVGFVLQADRRGNDEVICNGYSGDMNSKEFRKTIKNAMRNYGFKASRLGSFTDVVELQTVVPISMANIAAGYYGAHTDWETVVVRDVANLVAFTTRIIDDLGTTVRYTHPTSGYSGYNSWGKQLASDGSYAYQDNYYQDWGVDDESVDEDFLYNTPWWHDVEWHQDEPNGDLYVFDTAGQRHIISDLESEFKLDQLKALQNIRDRKLSNGMPSDEIYCQDCNLPVSLPENIYCDSCSTFYENQYNINPNVY